MLSSSFTNHDQFPVSYDEKEGYEDEEENYEDKDKFHNKKIISRRRITKSKNNNKEPRRNISKSFVNEDKENNPQTNIKNNVVVVLSDDKYEPNNYDEKCNFSSPSK